MNNELAERIFDELYDEDDLNELHKKKIIAQPLGFKLSTIAIIECELNAYHDRLTEENAKLRQEKENLLHELCSIQNACIGQIAMGYNLDAERIGHDISIATGMTNPELNELLNKLKEQQNEE